MKKLVLLLVMLACGLACGRVDTAERSKNGTEEVSWSAFQEILDTHLKEEKFTGKYGAFTHSSFDYAAFKKDEKSAALIKEQSEILLKSKVPTVKNEKLTFWINAYNYFTLVEVYNHFPVKSMEDIGWKNKVHVIGGGKYSLDEIEHSILRPLKEPRIHFAINCASVSCPSLKAKVYLVEKIEEDLSAQTRNAFLNPLHIGVIDGELQMTKLLSWFADDFKVAPYKSSKGFLQKFAPLVFHKETSDYLDYNWNLNNPQNVKEVIISLLK